MSTNNRAQARASEIATCLARAETLADFKASMQRLQWRLVTGPEQGDFSVVLISPCDKFAVKLFGDVAYTTFLDVVAADADNPFFPKVYARMPLPHNLMGFKEAVLLERLFNTWEAKPTSEAFGAYYALKHSGDDFANVTRTGYGKAFDRALTALEKAQRANWQRIKCDLNGRNMMYRANGSLVITDPLAPKR